MPSEQKTVKFMRFMRTKDRYGSYIGKDDFFSFFHSTNMYCTHVLGTVLGSGNRIASKTDRNPCPCGAYTLLGKRDKTI